MRSLSRYVHNSLIILLSIIDEEEVAALIKEREARGRMASSTLVKRKSPRISAKNIMRMSFGRGYSSKPDMSSGFFCDVGEVTAITAFCGGEDGTLFNNEQNSSQIISEKEQDRDNVESPGSAAAATRSATSSSTQAFPVESEGSSSVASSLAMEVGRSAHEYLEECLVTEVAVLDRDKFNAIPEYQKDQFSIVEHLGKGSYSDVFEVRLNVSIFDDENGSVDDIIERLGDLSASTSRPHAQVPKELLKNDAAHDDVTTGRRPPRAPRRLTLASSVKTEGVKRPGRCDERQIVYAMKCLRPQIRSDPDQFIIGAEDLVHETALLASLNHPNIIRLHGRAAGHLENAFTLNDGYFILLDRLKKETLKDFIGEWWRYPEFYLQGPTLRQVDISLSIAEAIEYLHSKNIVYRDLKPANVGFDSQGVVKLFDFGFAVVLPSENDVSNPAGLLFDKCGTPRYMAPEVGLELGYRTEADVYSFGMLLWEICALDKPFAEFKCPVKFQQAVFVKGQRPVVKKHWPVLITATLKKCWATRPSKRPSITSVITALREVKSSLCGGEGSPKKQPVYSRETRRLSINMGHDFMLG